MNIVLIVIKVLLYFIWFPILLAIFSGIGKLIKLRIQRSFRMGQKRMNPADIKPSFAKKLRRGVRFEMKGDKRPLFTPKKKKDEQSEDAKPSGITRTTTYWVIVIAGLLLTIVSSFTMGALYILALLLSMLSQFYAYGVSKGLLAEQENIKQRLYETKKSMMGLIGDSRNGINYDDEFKILEWAPDNIKFNKVLLYVPTSFDQLNANNVIDKMNQNFGGGTAWVADVDSDTHGWDFVQGKVTLKRTAELPHMAAWDAHYVLNDDIAWSFFPIGLGVENGVSLVNPETGKTENVLGFDLQGLEQKLGKKKGFDVGPEIIAAPQMLVAGGTGGGKSLVETTTVPTIEIAKIHDKDE